MRLKLINMNKLSATLGSQNFFVTILSIVLLGLQSNGIETGYTADGIFALFEDQNLTSALVLVVINFLNPIIKLVNSIVKKTWSWAFIRSQNFQTQLLSVATILLSLFLDEVSTGIVITIVLNIWNLVAHLIEKNESNEPQLPANTDN